MWNERYKITAMELKMRNLSLQIKKLIPHSFVPHSFIPHSLSLVHISEFKHVDISEINISPIEKVQLEKLFKKRKEHRVYHNQEMCVNDKELHFRLSI